MSIPPPDGVVRLGQLAAGRGTLCRMDTRTAARMLTAAGDGEALAAGVANGSERCR